jgi:TatA/E family protein of Tat protein translocase
MFGIGPLELVVILVVALLVFGPKRVPELARTVGRGLAEFRRASQDLRQTLALDELQQDLRRDLSGKQTIHRPEDRPAQAGGDGDDPGEKPASDASSSATNPNTKATSELPAQEPRPETTARQKHPGELPLGNDHEHHDVSDDDGADSSADAGSNSPTDSELGNVPVSSSKPADPRRG